MTNFIFNLILLLRGIALTKWRSLNVRVVGERRFECDNDDPQFFIRRRFFSGWYVLESQIDHDGPDASKLYLDLGEGFSEANVFLVPFHNPVRRKRFFFIPPNCKGIRFDPIESDAPFTILHFRIRRVFRRFAIRRMIRKLYQADLQVEPSASVKEIMSLYDGLFQRVARGNYELYLKNIEKSLWLPLYANTDIKISVAMAVYNPQLDQLVEAVHSVFRQNYPNWELCIADDASSESGVRSMLEQFAQQDSRVKVIFRSENGHISRASNSALSLCSGEFVALMDHDDLLAPHALNEVVHVIAANPDCHFVYSDEDKIDESGRRSDPHFKPDWNERLLYSQNYISHLGVYRRTLLEEVGGFRVGYEGSQDHDLLLRCVKACNKQGIFHIPKVLYHWRITQGSTAMGAGEKDYTSDAGLRALQDYFSKAEGVEVVPGKYPNTYRVRPPLPNPLPLVSLIIPTKNGKEITKQAIDSILEKTTYENYEIVLVDNNSDERDALQYFAELESHSRIRVLKYPHPFNFSAINNFAVQAARGEIVGLINNDIEVVHGDWLTEMVSHAVSKSVGCVGAKLFYPDGRVQHAGVILGIGGVAGHSHKYFHGNLPGYFSRLHLVHNVSAVTAAAMLVKKSIYLEVGGLEDEHLKVAFNDVDFCLKVREAGYQNVWTPYAELIHHESVSRGLEDSPEKLERFKREIAFMKKKWGALLENDPAYNRNLSLEHEDFSIGLTSWSQES